jgi:hypothetical protein
VPLKDQLDSDLRAALRSGDETRKSTLRLLLTAVRNAEIPPERDAAGAASESDAQRNQLDDDAILNLVRREVKQRRDSIDAYKKAGRADLVSREEAEVSVLMAYLPAQMSREEIAAVGRGVIERVGAKGLADKGKVMPAVISELRGRAEGGEINAVVTELLSQM